MCYKSVAYVMVSYAKCDFGSVSYTRVRDLSQAPVKLAISPDIARHLLPRLHDEDRLLPLAFVLS